MQILILCLQIFCDKHSNTFFQSLYSMCRKSRTFGWIYNSDTVCYVLSSCRFDRCSYYLTARYSETSRAWSNATLALPQPESLFVYSITRVSITRQRYCFHTTRADELKMKFPLVERYIIFNIAILITW